MSNPIAASLTRTIHLFGIPLLTYEDAETTEDGIYCVAVTWMFPSMEQYNTHQAVFHLENKTFGKFSIWTEEGDLIAEYNQRSLLDIPELAQAVAEIVIPRTFTPL